MIEERDQVNLFSLLETAKIPSWWPIRWPDIAADVLYYDTMALTPAEWVNAYKWLRQVNEGRILVVHPGGHDPDQMDPLDVRGALPQLDGIGVVVVAGCGTSRLGAIAFGRLVADALQQPVASVVAGRGMADLTFEGLSGVAAYTLNWLVEPMDDNVRAMRAWLPPAIARWADATAFANAYAIPEAATVHDLLLHRGGQFHTLVGHSKGNLALSFALHALAASLRDVDSAVDLEQKYGLTPTAIISAREAAGEPVVAAPSQLDVVTFGCAVALPGGYGAKDEFGVPAHQYLGNADGLGWSTTSPKRRLRMLLKQEWSPAAKVARELIVTGRDGRGGPVGHNLVNHAQWHPGYPFHMQADAILRSYKQAKGL
jgi:hypothetical protein